MGQFICFAAIPERQEDNGAGGSDNGVTDQDDEEEPAPVLKTHRALPREPAVSPNIKKTKKPLARRVVVDDDDYDDEEQHEVGLRSY